MTYKEKLTQIKNKVDSLKDWRLLSIKNGYSFSNYLGKHYIKLRVLKDGSYKFIIEDQVIELDLPELVQDVLANIDLKEKERLQKIQSIPEEFLDAVLSETS